MTLEEWLDLPETFELLYAVGGTAYVDAVYEVARLHAKAFAEPDPTQTFDLLRSVVALDGSMGARRFLREFLPAGRTSSLEAESTARSLLSICDEHLYAEATSTLIGKDS